MSSRGVSRSSSANSLEDDEFQAATETLMDISEYFVPRTRSERLARNEIMSLLSEQGFLEEHGIVPENIPGWIPVEPSSRKSPRINKKKSRNVSPALEPNQQSPVTGGKSGTNCPVCMEDVRNRRPYTTGCGHVFCKRCLYKTMAIRRRCPICLKFIMQSKMHPVYI